MVVLAPGPLEMLLLLFLGWGVPLGVPPGPEDPLLYRVAPEQCLYYTTWTGAAPAEQRSDNATERLLGDPDVRAFRSHAEQSLKAMALRQGGPQMVLAMEHAPELIKVLLTQPAAVFVSEVRLQGDAPQVEAAMIVRLDDSEAKVRAALAGLVRAWLGEAEADEVEILGTRFSRFQPDPHWPAITWGIQDNYFILGIGDDSVAGVLQRRKTPAPRWLVELQARFPVQRQATLTYADMQGILQALMPLAGDWEPEPLIDALGLANITSMQSITGLDQQQFFSQSLVEVDGPLRGLLAALVDEPMTAEDLLGIPADAMIALAVKLDGQQLFDGLLDCVENMDARATHPLREAVDHFGRTRGIDVRAEILGSLGHDWRVYASPREGGVLTGWTAAVSVRDRATLDEAHGKLLASFQNIRFQDLGSPRIQSSELNGHTIHTLLGHDELVVAPSWTIQDDQLLLALFPQALKAHLRRDEAKSLADVDRVRSALAATPAPTLLSYQDTSALLEMVYPLFQVTAHQALRRMAAPGLEMSVAQLPPLSAIAGHLQPSLTTVRQTGQGLLVESQRTIPGASVAMTAPLATAILLPAISASHQARRRMEAIMNLRQIGLAWHNYHDSFNGLPAAYNADDQGQPLLSWRVHILPFVEQQALYQQFRLDEPWHSEHNRKLILQMPAVYQAPGSASGPGKTNYLAVAGEPYVMVPPRQDRGGRPLGIGFRDVTDGTSNTIAVVEASDELAAIWTKPDDFQPQPEDPRKGLEGLRRGVFNVLFLDGSVRSIPATIDEDTLNALFTRAGGEPVRFPGVQPRPQLQQGGMF